MQLAFLNVTEVTLSKLVEAFVLLRNNKVVLHSCKMRQPAEGSVF